MSAADPGAAAAASLSDDLVQPFQVEASALRGRLVRLGPLVDTIIRRHAYPEPVARMLGEAIVLAVMLAGALKYDGIFTLQTKGDGPIHLMVVDVTTAGAVRGYCQFDATKLALEGADLPLGSVSRLLGKGYIAFTVDQGEHTDRYQGIVELEGESLADCAQHYFRQSEQIQAGLHLAVGRDPDGAWRAGGIMLQRLPETGGLAPPPGEAAEDGWRRAMVLLSSGTAAELLDRDLPGTDLLYRLFHEDGVRVWPAHGLEPRCRCSRERIERILRALPDEELQAMQEEEPEIRVTCEFCNALYLFPREEIAELRSS